jgi:large subunit ribosomal protein L23
MTVLSSAEIIVRPVISEKSIDLTTREPAHQYTFEVHGGASKMQIKDAVEELYKKDGVTVTSVNVLWTKARTKRRNTRGGRVLGQTSAWRKAVVTLAPGQKIEFFEGV